MLADNGNTRVYRSGTGRFTSSKTAFTGRSVHYRQKVWTNQHGGDLNTYWCAFKSQYLTKIWMVLPCLVQNCTLECTKKRYNKSTHAANLCFYFKLIWVHTIKNIRKALRTVAYLMGFFFFFLETQMFNSATHKRPKLRPRTRRSEDMLDRNLKSKALKKPSYVQYNQGPLPGTARHHKEVNAWFFFSQQLIS